MIARIWRGVTSAEQAIERAVYYSKDKEFLLELEPKVTHYDYESHQE